MHVPAGIPQGTWFKPWLFMINDLELPCDELLYIWKFADDTTISEIIPPAG